MRNLDLTPFFRSSIGFDKLTELFESTMREDSNISYPPYNIEKIDESHYCISMAVAGFGEDDLTITQQKNLLTVTGKLAQKNSNQVQYLYKGIANRAFEHKFSLADYMKITKADLENGLLSIELHREIPEEVKPKQIEINKVKTISN